MASIKGQISANEAFQQKCNDSTYNSGQTMVPSNQITDLYSQDKDHTFAKSETGLENQNKSYHLSPNTSNSKAPNPLCAQTYSHTTGRATIKTHTSGGTVCHGQPAGKYLAHGGLVFHGKIMKLMDTKADFLKEKSEIKKYSDGYGDRSDSDSN